MKKTFLIFSAIFLSIFAKAQVNLNNDPKLILWIPITNDSLKLDRSPFKHNIREIQNVVFSYDRKDEHNAYTFSGSSFIEMRQRQQFSYSTISICTWVKSSVTDKIGRLVVLPTERGGQVYSLNLNLSSNKNETATGKASIYFDKEDQSGAISVMSTTDVCDNQWHFIVGIINTQTHKMKIYVDGVLENERIFTSRPRLSDTKNLQIGRFSDNYGEYLYGALDDIRLYSRELTSAEIMQLYNQ